MHSKRCRRDLICFLLAIGLKVSRGAEASLDLEKCTSALGSETCTSLPDINADAVPEISLDVDGEKAADSTEEPPTVTLPKKRRSTVLRLTSGAIWGAVQALLFIGCLECVNTFRQQHNSTEQNEVRNHDSKSRRGMSDRSSRGEAWTHGNDPEREGRPEEKVATATRQKFAKALAIARTVCEGKGSDARDCADFSNPDSAAPSSGLDPSSVDDGLIGIQDPRNLTSQSGAPLPDEVHSDGTYLIPLGADEAALQLPVEAEPPEDFADVKELWYAPLDAEEESEAVLSGINAEAHDRKGVLSCTTTPGPTFRAAALRDLQKVLRIDVAAMKEASDASEVQILPCHNALRGHCNLDISQVTGEEQGRVSARFLTAFGATPLLYSEALPYGFLLPGEDRFWISPVDGGVELAELALVESDPEDGEDSACIWRRPKRQENGYCWSEDAYHCWSDDGLPLECAEPPSPPPWDPDQAWVSDLPVPPPTEASGFLKL